MSIKNKIKSILIKYYLFRIRNHKIKKCDSFDVDSSLARIEKLYKVHPYGKEDDYIKNKESYKYDLSLIIPVYNAESFLDECLNSLAKQKTTFQYEIILIDDGSTDNSLKILNDFKENNNNLNIVIRHQENQGISNTRNTGLKIAEGKYVGFIDNDDLVKETYVETLLAKAYEHDADYVKCGYEIFADKTGEVMDKVYYPDNVLDNQRSQDYFNYDGYIWGGIQKRELWCNFCFPSDFWYEDIITKLYLYQKCQRFVNVSDILYRKRSHEKNASLFVWSNKNVKCIDQLYLVKLIDEIKREQGINDSLLNRKVEHIELGPMLYRRTKGLSDEVQKDLFVIASDYIRNKKDQFVIEDENILIYYADLALNNKDFELWKLVGEYGRFTNQ